MKMGRCVAFGFVATGLVFLASPAQVIKATTTDAYARVCDLSSSPPVLVEYDLDAGTFALVVGDDAGPLVDAGDGGTRRR